MLVGLVALTAACNGMQRFPICHTDKECAEREGAGDARVCFNLKCVECHYDTDCASGEICTGVNLCEKNVSVTSPAAGSEPVVASAQMTAEPSCSTRCEGDACDAVCHETTAE